MEHAVSRQASEFRQWPLVLAGFTGQLFSVGSLVVYSFGLFLIPLTQLYGWDRLQVSGALTVFNYSVVVAAFAYGWLIDRYQARSVVLVSTAAFGLVFGSAYWLSPSLWHLYVLFALFALLGGGTLPVGHARLIVGSFHRHRGLALGVTLAGVGFGAAVLPPIVTALIANSGVQTTFLVLAGGVLLVALPVGLLFLREST